LVVYDCKKSTLKILESSKINNLDEPKSLHWKYDFT
jgi:hypothetical protein